ncbi:GlcG/HbpS family heme-binding protein [Balneatrix alpica]|uniref:Heme-binding protein n=1 Tax=Balneatrix alpica TaxID=75684 RepID=A0ABV5ZCR8_9GAMM|nr:heme-binding protein [Balneatrix alpica]
MNNTFTHLLAGLSLSLFATVGHSATLNQQPLLSQSSSQQLAELALQACQKDGYNVAVSVVDSAGTLRAFVRSDFAGPHTVSSSFRKAYTAASMGRNTAELGQLIADKPELAGLAAMDDNLLLLGGGLPLQQDGKRLGGIGVGGAPGGHLDQACAEQAIQAVFAN